VLLLFALPLASKDVTPVTALHRDDFCIGSIELPVCCCCSKSNMETVLSQLPDSMYLLSSLPLSTSSAVIAPTCFDDRTGRDNNRGLLFRM